MIIDRFIEYHEEEEATQGEYWKFANMTEDELYAGLKEENPYSFLPIIISQIKNPALKEKMKSNLTKLFLKSTYPNYLSDKIYSQEEMENLVYSVVGKRISEFNRGDNIDWINRFSIVDEDFLIELYDRFYESDPTCHSIALEDMRENFLLIYHIDRINIRNLLLDIHKEVVPLEYKRFKAIEEDPYYVRKKADKMLEEDDDLSIGIDSRTEIGCEIESNNDYNLFFDAGEQIGIGEYHSMMEHSAPDGVEVITPVFHDVPEDIAVFKAVLDTMREQGFYYDEKKGTASGQINIGLNSFNSPLAFLIFMETYCNTEEVYYHIANKEWQEIRNGINDSNTHSKPISKLVGKRNLDKNISWEDAIALFDMSEGAKQNPKVIQGLDYKKNSICLRDRKRLELRVNNASTVFKDWKENILLVGKMVEAANRLADIVLSNRNPSSEEARMIELYEKLKDEELDSEDRLNTLMNLIFANREDLKEPYYSRYYAVEMMINENQIDKYDNVSKITKQPLFGTVDLFGCLFPNIKPSKDVSPSNDSVEIPSP